METSITKCFICDVECDADEKFLGTNIARTLTTPISAVLAKCLRTIVDTDNEYFCSECTRKIEEYDQMVQLSLQIETELYELFRKKPIESCYLLDAEIISDPDGMPMIESVVLKIEDESQSKNASGNDLTESCDEMVVEYLDEYETQSNDNDDLHTNETDETISSDKVADLLGFDQNDVKKETDIDTVEIEQTVEKRKGRKKKKPGPKSRTIKKKATTKRTEKQLKEEINLDCKQCSFTASSREEFEEHKTTEHFEEGKRHLKCDICGRTYKSKSALCVHLGTHNGRSPHGKIQWLFFEGL